MRHEAKTAYSQTKQRQRIAKIKEAYVHVQSYLTGQYTSHVMKTMIAGSNSNDLK